MKINIQNTSLKISAGLPSQFPRDTLPQVVFSGRSNVGKSSLLNTLTGRKSLARVSSAPGKTITVNFYDVDRKLYLVDLPGYGYAKRAATDQKRWSGLTDTYLNKGGENKKRLFVQLIDMRIGPTEDDYMMLDWLDSVKADYIIAATKSDKLNKTDYKEAKNELEKLGAVLIPFSSQSGEGKNELWNAIYEFLDE